ncbi:hypothetical protein BDF22DRAFT_503360 [Syncephalis plumigaleata]|nr:hypothetical protein BDF22DRAFT_503360 [Syncephalis plumigaleata]
MQVQDKQHSLTSCDHIAFVASSYDRDMVQSSRSSGKSSRQSDSSFYSMSHILFILVLSMLTLLSSSCLLATSLQGVDAAVTSASNHHLVRREIMNIGSPVTPQWRAFHTASLSGNYMIIYGGVANSRDAFSQPGTSDLFVYYIKDGRWYKPRMINAPTNGQRMHSAITIEDGMILFYATNFTGTDPESRNPIMMLYPSSWSWSIPKPNVSTPLSRVRQTFTYVNKRAYMYGGSTQDPNGDINTGSISNGLVEMNVESREWIDRPSGQARQGHTACYLSSSNSILVFGGVDNTFKTINQLNVYKLDDKTWDSSPVIDVDKGFPSARMGHTATCLDNKMIVFESIDKGKKYLWSKPQMKNTNHAPPPRMGHTAVLIGNRILFWGGVSNSDDLRMYALDTDTWTWSHAEVDSMLPEPGEVSQDGEKKNDNGTVVIIVPLYVV